MMKGTISTILNWLRVPNTVYYVLSHFGQRFSESLRCCDRWIKSIEFNIIILEYILKKDHITWCKLLQTLWVDLKATENYFHYVISRVYSFFVNIVWKKQSLIRTFYSFYCQHSESYYHLNPETRKWNAFTLLNFFLNWYCS